MTEHLSSLTRSRREPILSDREHILKVCDLIVEVMPTEQPPTARFSMTELTDIVDFIRADDTMPDDMAARWLGYIFGQMDIIHCVESENIRRVILGIGKSTTLLTPNMTHAYSEITPHLKERFDGLRGHSDIEEASIDGLQRDLDYVSGLLTFLPVPRLLWASFQVGYCRGILLHFRQIDLGSEQDRCRMILTRAYNEAELKVA